MRGKFIVLENFLEIFHVAVGNGNPPQYSCLENPVDRGAWWTAVRRDTHTVELD